MKLKLLIPTLVIPFFCFSQWSQLGDDIQTTTPTDHSRHAISNSLDGTIVAIGTYSNNGNVINSGNVSVYKFDSNSWSQIGSDINGESAGDFSGSAISISNNGSIIAIGAPQNDGNGENSGHVRVFKNVSGIWTLIGDAIDGNTTGDAFGSHLSLSGDGNILAIGSLYSDGNGNDSGHVSVFKNIANVWTKYGNDIIGKFDRDSFARVSLSNNGNTLAIGAIGNGTGYVSAYKMVNSIWSQIGNDIIGDAINDNFGTSVSLNANGTILAIGASGNSTNSNKSGFVRIYKNSENTWTQIGNTIYGIDETERLGYSVSLSHDGHLVAIGAPGKSEFNNASGQTQVFENNANQWIQKGNNINGQSDFEETGLSVSLSGNGKSLVIGSWNNDNADERTGNVRVFGEAILNVEENTFDTQFSLFPNPSYGSSIIQLGQYYKNISLSIFNVLGKQIITKKYNNTNSISLNTKAFASGLYFINIKTESKKAILKLIVK